MKEVKWLQRNEYVGISDFQLEVLYDCRWNCSGCNIDKTGQNGFKDGDINKLMHLFADMKQQNVVLGNLAIGPTDFMVSSNFEEVFTEQLKPMFDMFGAILLNTTFLSNKETMDKAATVLRPLLKDCLVKFSIPIEPRHYKTPKYMKTLLENKEYFCNLLPESKFGKVYLIANLHEYKAYQEDPFQNDKITFEEYSDVFHSIWNGGHVDLVISDGRRPLSNLFNRNHLKNIVQYLNNLYNTSIISDSAKKIVNFTYGKPTEGNGHYNFIYRNGNLYWPVFVGEPLILFEEDFKIPDTVDWTFETLVCHEQEALVKSLDYVIKHTKHCHSCEFANKCVQGGLIMLMKNLGITECFAPKHAFHMVKQVA